MQTAAIQISAAGPTLIVPGRAGFNVLVFAFSLSAVPLSDDPANTVYGLVKWRSSGGTDLTGFRALTMQGLSWDFSMTAMRLQRPDAYFQTLAGEDLQLFQEAAFDLGGFCCYEFARE